MPRHSRTVPLFLPLKLLGLTEVNPLERSANGKRGKERRSQRGSKEEEITAEKKESEISEEKVEKKPGEEPTPAPKKGVQKRIDELVREREDQRREAEYWKNLALVKEKEPEKKEVVRTSDAEPKLAEFESYDDYVRALAKWEIHGEGKRKAGTGKRDIPKISG